MTHALAFLFGTIAGVAAAVATLALAAAVDQARRDPLEAFDAPADVIADPYLELMVMQGGASA